MKATKEFRNLYDLQKKFKDENVCKRYLEKIRWNNRPICPFCNSNKIYKLADKKRYKCANNTCKRTFTVTVGTFLENTKLPLSKWFVAIYLIGTHRKGISSEQLAEDLGITQKSAWFLLHRVREMLKSEDVVFSGIVEADETLYGGKEKNKYKVGKYRHRKNRGLQGRSTLNKTPIFGVLKRGKKIYATKVDDTKKCTLQGIIKERVKKGSTIVTDEWKAYRGLKDRYRHLRINHRKGIYVRKSVYAKRDGVHTNGGGAYVVLRI